MSDQNVTITPGLVATLSVSMADGATVQNLDTDAAVWLSASPGVAPGTGTRLGPKGSVQWSTAGAPCYAVTDTGVTTPVSLTISTDISMPVNPVDVASAVAARLLATGVPSVLVGGDVPYYNISSNIDVSHYASLTVTVRVINAGKLTYTFTSDEAGWQVTSQRTIVVAVPNTYVRFNVPVNGPYFNVFGNDTASLANLAIYGTNRVLKEQLLNTTPGASRNVNQAWLSNGSTQDLGLTITTNGGPHQLRMAVTGSGKGLLMATIWDEPSQTLIYIPVANTVDASAAPSGVAGVIELQKVIYLPAGVLKFGFISYLAASYQIITALIPPT